MVNGEWRMACPEFSGVNLFTLTVHREALLNGI